MNGNPQGQPVDPEPLVLQDRKITDVPLTFVDVETTGLSPRDGDRVCEIALIRQEPGQPEQTYSTLIDPQRPISPGAFRVNRITESMLDGAPRFDAIIDKVEALFRDSVIVAHNASFDLGFLRSEYHHCGREFAETPVIDTLYLARQSGRYASCSLGALARALGLRNEQAHRALGDCRVTQKLLFALIGSLFPPSSTPSIGELVNLPFSTRLGPADTDELPDELAALVEGNSPFTIVYERAEGAVHRYDVRVTSVGRLGPHLYLAAHAINRQAERHFRLDRIISWHPYTPMTHTSNDRSLDIRPMTEEELGLLYALWDAAELRYKPQVRDSLENLAKQRSDNPDGFIGAFDGARLVGFVLASDDTRRGWINRIAVHPDFRRTGLASRLVVAAEEELRRRGMQIIAALIEDYNTASRGLFEKSGYSYLPEVLYYSKRDSWDV